MSCAWVKTYNGVQIQTSLQNVCGSECVSSTTFNTLNDWMIWRKPTNDAALWWSVLLTCLRSWDSSLGFQKSKKFIKKLSEK